MLQSNKNRWVLNKTATFLFKSFCYFVISEVKRLRCLVKISKQNANYGLYESALRSRHQLLIWLWPIGHNLKMIVSMIKPSCDFWKEFSQGCGLMYFGNFSNWTNFRIFFFILLYFAFVFICMIPIDSKMLNVNCDKLWQIKNNLSNLPTSCQNTSEYINKKIF